MYVLSIISFKRSWCHLVPHYIDCIYCKMYPEDFSINSMPKVILLMCRFVARVIVLYTAMDYKIINSYDFEPVPS